MNEVGGTCSMYDVDEKCIQNFKERDCLRDLSVDGRVLKIALKQ
jgi:hypothetical protein